MAKVNPKTVNIWTARFIPVLLMGIVGYATYVLVVRLCSAFSQYVVMIRADVHGQSITSSKITTGAPAE